MSPALPPLPLEVPAFPRPGSKPLPAFPKAGPWPGFPSEASGAARFVAPAAPPPQAPEPDPMPSAPPPAAEEAPEPPDFTDADLAEALRPLLGGAASDLDLEAALRAAFRRTYAQNARSPFDPPGFLQRLRWRFEALFASRSYEEILQRKIGRFRVEEVHLLDRDGLAQISFASVNPGRHTDARKVHATAARLAAGIRDHGPAPCEFGLDGELRALVRPGRHTLLAAIVRGRPDPLAAADLDHALHRLEARFGDAIATGEPLLEELQPLLEECLLIHSPIAPLPA